MPDLDGLGVLKRLAAIQPDLPVIILTAFATIATAIEAVNAGAFDYLSKPFRMEEIKVVAGLRRAWRRRSSLGDEILVVAFPWGQRFTVVRGVVSQIAGPPGELLVTGLARMVDASVTYGWSGGVFDTETGELGGIVESYRTAKVSIPE